MKTKKEVLTDPLLKKGGAHRILDVIPDVCPSCGGSGLHLDSVGNPEACFRCGGEGVVYE